MWAFADHQAQTEAFWFTPRLMFVWVIRWRSWSPFLPGFSSHNPSCSVNMYVMCCHVSPLALCHHWNWTDWGTCHKAAPQQLLPFLLFLKYIHIRRLNDFKILPWVRLSQPPSGISRPGIAPTRTGWSAGSQEASCQSPRPAAPGSGTTMVRAVGPPWPRRWLLLMSPGPVLLWARLGFAQLR